MTTRHNKTRQPSASNDAPFQLPTFLEHLHELRRRLFWVVAFIIVASSAAYPFLNNILSVLVSPLKGQRLYYLTPVGGFSFSIKLCLYVGILFALPCIVYHLYRYVQPLMGQQLRRSVLFYTGLSTALAVAGLCFAYFVSLPSALHFLTGMNLANIQAMLTVDSYLTFVTTYLLGAALLFQVPLLLLVINTITPLKPSKLMKVQRYVIVVAFLIAAIISPTPDVVNQALLAIPIIVMYEIGVIFVWLQNRARARKEQPTPELLRPLPVPAAPLAQPPISADRPHVRRRTSMDVFTSRAALRGPASLGKHNNAEQATP